MSGIDLLVRPEDARPAGKPDECFYCKAPMGAPHKWECVIPTKRVRLRTTFEYEVDVPRSWDAENIEFHRNESSSCAQNIIQDIETFAEAEFNGCLCGHAETEFVRDVLSAREGK